MTNIVVVGAGFGGLQTVLNLEKQFKNNKSIALTLIDKRDYHLFTPNLYEVASSEEELVSISQVKKSITLPIRQILAGKKINFIKGEFNSLDPVKKELKVGTRRLEYDYLVLALGSQSDFFGIQGAKENALALKDLPDALRIRNKLEFVIQAHKFDFSKKTLRIVVAGGGYTGLELAAELKGLIDYLAWKNEYPREKIEIEVIEAGNKLVPGFDSRLSDDAYERLQDLGIHVRLSSRISAVTNNFIELIAGDKIGYDVLLWATGVRACLTHTSVDMVLDKKGRLPVNEFFQTKEYHNIFALGDVACIMGTNHQPVPGSAQDAWHQARYLAYAFPYLIKNKKPPLPYKNIAHGFIVNLGGKWAIFANKTLYTKGFFAYFINQVAHLRYFLSLVGLWKALKYLLFQEEMYSRND